MNEQVIATMDRLGDWLNSVNMSWDNVVDVSTVLADINDLESFNEAYGNYLANQKVKSCPAQTCFQPSGICGQDAGALCEIAVIASASPKVIMSEDKATAMAMSEQLLKLSEHQEVAWCRINGLLREVPKAVLDT